MIWRTALAFGILAVYACLFFALVGSNYGEQKYGRPKMYDRSLP